MVGGIKKFIKANNFPWVTFIKYWKSSSRSELIVDVFLPFTISILILYWTSIYLTDFRTLIEKFHNLSGQIIAAISILAGFNITSITVISSVGNYTNRLKRKSSSDNQTSVFEMLIVFFTWAVIIQLIVVLLSILLYYVGSFIPNQLCKDVPLWAWGLASLWLTLTVHSVFISIRNIKTLYLYVTYKPEGE